MIRHIIIAAWRNMMANKLLSVIAIAGLAVGITTLLTAVSVVRGLSRWDQFIPGHERIVLVTMPPTRPGPAYSFNSDARIAGLLKLGLPEIESATRLVTEGGVLRHGNVIANETFYWADPTTFDVLPLPVYRGDPNVALSTPDGLVLTRSIARKYFGRDDVVGESIALKGRPMTVRAVIEDLPSQTELQHGVFVSARSPDADPRLAAGGAAGAGDGGIMTFLRLRQGASPDSVRQRAHDAIMPVLAERPFKGGGADADAPFLLRTDRGIWSEKINPGFLATMALGFAVCALLLFIAAVNFVNMMTARAARRATEVSMRKACGASRGTLILQFLGESILTVFFATCIALAVNEWLLGRISGLGQAVPLDFWDDPLLLAALLLGVVLLGVASGAWPAFVLSSFRPVRALKGMSSDVGRTGFIRSGLVTLQFAALIGFIVAALVLYQQHLFAVNRPLGVKIGGMLMLETDCSPVLFGELRKLPQVADAACTGEEFFTNNSTIAFPYHGATNTFDLVRSDVSAFALYGIRPLAGSLAAMPSGRTDPGAGQGIVLNQSAVRKLGFASPQAAIGQIPAHAGELSGRVVLAVVPDFALYSIERPMEATIFVPMAFKACCERVSVKLRREPIPQTMAVIDHVWTATGGEGPLRRHVLDQRLQSQYDDLLQSANLFTICALVAVFLACLGLFGMAISTAERRTKEIGIRKAMGAGNRQIVALLLWQFAQPVLWANVVAWPVAWWLMRRWLSGFAYHVDLHWWVFAGASLVALFIALLTVAGQAFLTARQKPVLALRTE